MHVLVVGPAPRLWATNGLPWLEYTAAALRRLGHDVTVVPYRESWAASRAMLSRAETLPGGASLLARFAAEMDLRRDRRLVGVARRIKPDLTVILKGEVFSDETLAEVKKASAGPIVAWWVDNPFVYPASVDQFTVLDRVFVFDRFYVSELAKAGIGHAAFLPCACDETVYRPLDLSAAERRQLGADVSFVASHYPERAVLVRVLVEAGVDVGVWGTGWRDAAARGECNGRLAPRGGIVTADTVARIYNASKIGMNVHHPQTRLAGINMRTFELLAAGTLALMDRVPGMEELLEPGRDVICYESTEEAVDLAQRYVKDAEGRATIVARGRARVLAEHTYVARMETVCRLACA